ncbi:MAG: rRNA maturation RNase YbeY [Gammaproteobacteria bacterium]|nr:rRNA maturation RNase YbeY [Gammaproteobacteria bacterium]MDH3505595.1 rRNA maturation RNase YbeY [Gammaproteobacteria bacterium]
MSSRSNDASAAPDVHVEDVSGFEPVPGAVEISGWVQSALAAAACREISIRIVGEAESAALNERYRGRAGPTNVLAFAGPDPVSGPEPLLLGDIVICAPVVAREAVEQGKPIDAHWAHIAIHGVLHLLGFEHDSEAGAEAMERHEAALLADLGFNDPYR